jgi:hypothetical protein
VLKRIAIAACGIAAAVGLTGCVDDYGYGRSSYGVYGGYGAGYGDGYGYGPGYYDGGYGYAGSFGWYGDYYYPGTGVYVYDRYRRPHRWNSAQQRYWLGRRNYAYGGVRPQDRREIRQNWGAFRQDRQGDRQAFRQQRQGERQALQSGVINRDQFRTQRREARQSFRQEQRGDRRALGRANRRAVRN